VDCRQAFTISMSRFCIELARAPPIAIAAI
jgi:hypothetical protein